MDFDDACDGYGSLENSEKQKRSRVNPSSPYRSDLCSICDLILDCPAKSMCHRLAPLARSQKHKQLGLTIVAAHGNATTDIFAYQKAKVAQVYIIGTHGGQKKTQRISGSWQSPIDRLNKRAAKDR